MEIRALRESDDREGFRSGDADLDRFLHKYAGQNQFRHHIGTTYIAIEENRIAGFATVAPGHLEGRAFRAPRRSSRILGMPFATGARFGSYGILAPLGAGGMGEVSPQRVERGC